MDPTLSLEIIKNFASRYWFYECSGTEVMPLSYIYWKAWTITSPYNMSESSYDSRFIVETQERCVPFGKVYGYSAR